MKKWLVSFLALTSALFGQIHEVRDMAELFHHLEGKGEWALFDIDLVLVQPSDPAFQMANVRRHRDFARATIGSLSEEDKSLFLCMMAFSDQHELVDPQIVTYLEHLERSGIPAMALTANLSGAAPGVPSIPEAKLASLRQLGIDFSQSAPHADDLWFDELPRFLGSHPRYQEGVLFSNGGCCKGEALVAFCRRIGSVPSKVVFVDDRRHNLEDVERALGEAFPEVAFVGLHYTAANDLPAPELSAEAFAERWQQLLQCVLDN